MDYKVTVVDGAHARTVVGILTAAIEVAYTSYLALNDV